MRCFAAVIFFFININVFAQQPLIPFRIGNKWGFADTTLTIKIKPEYEGALPFENGYGKVFKNNKAGLINRSGKLVVPIRYDWIEFVYGEEIKYAMPRTWDYKTGLYSLPKGKLLLDTIYTELYKVKESLFVAHNKEHGIGVFDAAKAKWIAKPVYDNILQVTDNEVRAVKEDTEYTISHTGKISQQVLSPPEMVVLEEVEAKPSEIQNVKPVDPPKPKDTVSTPSYNMNLPVLYQENGKWGYRFIYDFQDELRNSIKPMASYPDSIPAVYDSIDTYYTSYKHIAVKKEGKWGVVNSKNEVVVPFLYEGFDLWRSSVQENIYAVKNNGKFGLITKNGEWLAEQLDEIKRRDGFFILRKDLLLGLLIVKGNEKPLFISPKYVEISEDLKNIKTSKQDYSLIYVRTQNGGGYLSLKGKEFFRDY